MKDFEVRDSRNGRGVFTLKNFVSEDVLFQITGKLISCDIDEDIDETIRANAIRFDEDMYISPEGKLGNFLNHSCNPNIKILKNKEKLFVVAIKDIHPQDEVVFDYSTITAPDDVWSMKCNCGSSICRGVVRKFDSLPREIKEKYFSLDAVPDYILGSEYTKEEKKFLRTLNTPHKIQDYLNSIPFNFEKAGATLFTPRQVISQKTAHCMEGALFAAAALEFHGRKPWIVDLCTTSKPFDFDHVIAVFEEDGYFGSISKTNHGVLRYREPVYKTLRELVMSFFHEYFLHSGHKTLRSYSDLFDLSKSKLNWRTGREDVWYIPETLEELKHYSILTPKQIRNLRSADPVEIQMGKIVEN